MYPKEYIDFLINFHAVRDYFECHEVLEDYWKKFNDKNEAEIWVGYIQLAVALYHHRIENYNGASKTLHKAIHIFEHHKEKIINLGIDEQKLLNILHDRLNQIDNKVAYSSLNIPINDSTLLMYCLEQCKQKGLNWGNKSDMSNTYLLYKHSLRNRADVINERNRQLELRKRQRPLF